MTEETTTTATGEERPLRCFVRHEDAGDPCSEPSVVEVYGLPFCEAHGLQATLGAALEEQHEVEVFAERFRDRGMNSPVEKALRTLAHRGERAVSDQEHWEALARAYGNAPADVREKIAEWEADEDPGRMSVLDDLLDTLYTLHKLQRIAHEEWQTYLVEILERERESVAAQTAVALEHANQRRDEREAERAK